MHLHPVHTQNNILTFQDDKTHREHSPEKLEWHCTDHLIGNHLDSESANGIWYFSGLESYHSLLSIG
jgi:hypothetical protein